ncbi:hypothetical protein [Altererythrobacter sp.]|uniref:hypothetical protein n=1 Tax=Altererythrobacter sp. TaxID=1872480 RepID=UPI003CFEB838
MEKITGIAGTLAIILAVVAGFVPIPGLDTALVLLVLGVIGGITASQDTAVRIFLAVLVLPVVGATLGSVPAVGEYLTAIFNNLAVAAAGIAASLVARRVYDMAMAGIKGLSAG